MIRSWGEYAAEVIAEVIAEQPGAARKRRCGSGSRQAYPFGERRMWPYKAWLREVRLALRREYGTGQGTRYSDERQEALVL
jgi:hypothetical protein